MKLYYDIKTERHIPRDMDGPAWEEGYYHFEPDDYIGHGFADKAPKWYRDLTPFEDGIKHKIEFIKKHWGRIINSSSATSFKTAKTCPAFINFFKQSIAMKTPADIFIEIFKDEKTGDIQWQWKTTDNFWTISGHDDAQIGDMSENSLVLKFSHEIMWMADEDCQFQYVEPFITNMVHYRVCPGVIHLKKGSMGSFNMPVFFSRTPGQYYIPAGTTIAYIQFNKPIKKLIRKNMMNDLKKSWYKIFVIGDHNEHIGK